MPPPLQAEATVHPRPDLYAGPGLPTDIGDRAGPRPAPATVGAAARSRLGQARREGELPAVRVRPDARVGARDAAGAAAAKVRAGLRGRRRDALRRRPHPRRPRGIVAPLIGAPAPAHPLAAEAVADGDHDVAAGQVGLVAAARAEDRRLMSGVAAPGLRVSVPEGVPSGVLADVPPRTPSEEGRVSVRVRLGLFVPRPSQADLVARGVPRAQAGPDVGGLPKVGLVVDDVVVPVLLVLAGRVAGARPMVAGEVGRPAGARCGAPPRVAGAIHGRAYDRRPPVAEAASGGGRQAGRPLPRPAGATGQVETRAPGAALDVPGRVRRRQEAVVLHPRLLAGVGAPQRARPPNAAVRPPFPALVTNRLGDPTAMGRRLKRVNPHCEAPTDGYITHCLFSMASSKYTPSTTLRGSAASTGNTTGNGTAAGGSGAWH